MPGKIALSIFFLRSSSQRMMPPRGPRSVLWVVLVTTCAWPTGGRVHARRHEPRDVGDVRHQERADLVGDRAEGGEVDGAGVGGRAALDQLRAMLAREVAQLVEVDLLPVPAHAVGHDLVELAREVDGAAVGQVAAVVEVHREDRVARAQERLVDRRVRLGARVRLHVRVVCAEELLGALDREGLHLVDHLAAAVVAPAGVALGVLVREHAADRLEDGLGDEVLGGDQLDGERLAAPFEPQQPGDGRIDRVEGLQRGSFRAGVGAGT